MTLRSGQAADLGPGDLIPIPYGQEHTLADSPERRSAPMLDQVIEQTSYDGSRVFVVGEGNPAASTQPV